MREDIQVEAIKSGILFSILLFSSFSTLGDDGFTKSHLSRLKECNFKTEEHKVI